MKGVSSRRMFQKATQAERAVPMRSTSAKVWSRSNQWKAYPPKDSDLVAWKLMLHLPRT